MSMWILVITDWPFGYCGLLSACHWPSYPLHSPVVHEWSIYFCMAFIDRASGGTMVSDAGPGEATNQHTIVEERLQLLHRVRAAVSRESTMSACCLLLLWLVWLFAHLLTLPSAFRHIPSVTCLFWLVSNLLACFQTVRVDATRSQT